MSDLASQISALEDQLENLRRQQAIEEHAARNHTPAQKLAVQMHEAMCHHNHADGCGWHYEIQSGTKIHNWSGSAHEHWLGRANIPTDTAIAVMKFVATGT